MTNEEILANAPEGATHYDRFECAYYKNNSFGHWVEVWGDETDSAETLSAVDEYIHNLDDIRTIVELEARCGNAEEMLEFFMQQADEVTELLGDAPNQALLAKDIKEAADKAEAHFMRYGQIKERSE